MEIAGYPADQSVWGRAKEDFLQARRTFRFYIAGAIVTLVAGITAHLVGVHPVMAIIATAFAPTLAMFILFIGFLVTAPYRQRNEARAELNAQAQQGLQVHGPYFRIDYVDGSNVPVWYVTVENTHPGSLAKNVRVRMDNPLPGIEMSFPITLHRLHDNVKPYEKLHDIRYGEPLTLDLLACGQLNPDIYYLFRADGDERSQEGPDWMLMGLDNDLITEASRTADGWQFDVIATPDPPMLGATLPLTLRRVDDADWPSLEART